MGIGEIIQGSTCPEHAVSASVNRCILEKSWWMKVCLYLSLNEVMVNVFEFSHYG